MRNVFVAVGLMVWSLWTYGFASEPPAKECFQLYDRLNQPLLDVLEWDLTPVSSVYAWTAEGFYRFTGNTRILQGPGIQDIAVFVGANTTNFFGAHHAVLLTVSWPLGRTYPGKWEISTEGDVPFSSSGTLSAVLCEAVSIR